MKEKTASHILQVPFRRFPPLVAGATTFPPRRRWDNQSEELHPLNPHAAGVSNGARQHRHLERGNVPVWGVDANRSDDTLSLKSSCRNAARTIGGGDFSTPFRSAPLRSK